MKASLLATSAIAAVSLGLSCQAHAQTAQTNTAADSQVVVITAQKRAENVQSVPLSVNVVSSDTLAKAGATDFTDVAKLAPSMTVTTGDQPANSAIVIRGVGTFAFSIAVEPSVLVVVDDVAAGMQAQAFTDLADIDHVEVLNGPQSTLYGKSSSAGVVSVTTKLPSKHFTAFGSVSLTDDHDERAQLSVSGPLSDTLGGRFSVSQRKYDGNVTNVYNGHMLNGHDALGLRGQLRWQPTGDFDARLIAHWNKDDTSCCAQPFARMDPGATLYGVSSLTPAVALPGIPPSPDNNKVALDVDPIANSSDYGASLHLAYSMPTLTFTSITAANHYGLKDTTDNDSTVANVLPFFTPFTGLGGHNTPASTGGIIQGGTFKVTTFSQEFRLTSNSDGPFNYVVGAYISSEDLVRDFFRGPFNPKGAAQWRGQSSFRNYALFGQSTWAITPKTTLVTGLRYNSEVSSYTFDDIYKATHFPLAGAPTSDTSSVTLGKIGLQYQFTKDVMGFVTASQGYKGAAYDLTSAFNAAIAAKQPIHPEKSMNYEAGFRSQLFEHRLLLNATVFSTDYTDFQVQSIIPDIPNTFVLTNVGGVHTQGLEMQWGLRVTDHFRLNGGLALIDAKITDYPKGQCYSGETCPLGYQDLKDKKLPNAPSQKFNINTELKVPTPSLPFDTTANLSYAWQSKILYSITQDPGAEQKAFGIANLNVNFAERANNRYTVTVFCNNLFDTHYAANLANQRGNWGSTFAYTQILPRDFSRYSGVRLAFAY